MWHHIWLNVPRPEDEFYAFYERSRAKFSRTVGPGGSRIRDILKSTGTGELTWNAPKGREKEGEEPQQTAAREVEEETNIRPSQYSVFPNITPITKSYEDETTVYVNQWYLAQMLQNDTPVCINFGNREQIQEITGIRWAGLRELRQMNLEPGAIENIELAIRLFRREIRRTDPVQ
jgi:8-oxo-dGTP pyrophosphatase MutT (NUDIX family)